MLYRLSEFVFAFDVDPTAIAIARQLEAKDTRFNIFHRPFGDLASVVPIETELYGVIADLGYQIMYEARTCGNRKVKLCKQSEHLRTWLARLAISHSTL